MTERPILFSGPMVRAIFEGRKTQTRRVVKLPKNFKPDPAHRGDDRANILATVRWYAQPRDTLWVRETWAKTVVLGQPFVVYRSADTRTDYGGPWKPGIHMPREACRLRLLVRSIRVERLQEISEADAIAEGCNGPAQFDPCARSARERYRELWDSLNAERGYGWKRNPWVWVVKFVPI